MTLFWLGYCLGVLTVIAWGVRLHFRDEKRKRQQFERDVQAAEATWPSAALPPPTNPKRDPGRKDVH